MQVFIKGGIKALNHLDPVHVFVGYFVQFILKPSGEVNINDAREIPGKQVINHNAQLCRLKAAVGFYNVFTLLDCGQDGGIGAGTPDTPLLQHPD